MTITRHQINGYDAFTVAGRLLSLTCLPGRGAHLTSIRQGAHEWLWAPPDGPGLAPISADSDFDPHQEGGDDCLPTVAEDLVLGVHYEDHGAVWQRPWRVLRAVDRLVLEIDLPTCGLSCRRSIVADGDGLRLDWRLTSHVDRPVPYVWCWHPLFAWHPGDRLELPGADLVHLRRRGRYTTGAWPRPGPGYDLSTGEIDGRPNLKSFVAGVGSAVLHSAGTRLLMRWDPLVLPWTGLWMKQDEAVRQWAIEPTNICGDSLGEFGSTPPATVLPARSERGWSILLQP